MAYTKKQKVKFQGTMQKSKSEAIVKRQRKQRVFKEEGGLPTRKRVRGSGDYMVSGGVYGEANLGFGKVGGHLMGKISGSGDYKKSPFSVQNNVLVNSREIPQFSTGRVTNVVCHREFVKDIITGSAGTFNADVFPLQPGSAITFPWLAKMADSFQEYKIHGMLFEYKSMSADALNSTNTALGQVIMATQYNVLDAPFVNKFQMENWEYSQSIKPSESALHAIECANGENPTNLLYTRSTTNVTGADLRFYDMGNFTIATNGFQASNVNIGELWVTYCVEFFKPKIYESQPLGPIQSLLLKGVTPASATPFGTSSVVTGTLTGTVTTTNITITDTNDGFQAGQMFLLDFVWYGANTAIVQPTIGLGTGITFVSAFNNASATFVVAPATGTSTTTQNLQIAVSIVSPRTSFVVGLTGGTYPSGGYVDVIVTPIDASVY